MVEVKLPHDIAISYPVGSDMDGIMKYIKEAVKAFKSIEEFNHAQAALRPVNLFCRGSSGAICAALFASMLQRKTKIIHVKKNGEQAHSGSGVSTWCDTAGINIIIDDFISSGETVNKIYNAIVDFYERQVRIDVLIVGWGYSHHVNFKPDYLISK